MFTNTEPTPTSQPTICTDCWSWWCLWLHWYHGEDWAATAWCQRTRSWTVRITVPQWVLSEVAWWASPAVLQGLPLTTKETELTLFTDASSSGWRAQLSSRLTQGQRSASQRSWHFNVLEMQAVINAVRDFPSSSEVPCGALDVRQRIDCGLHQERGRHTIVHTNPDDDTPAQVMRSQGNHVDSRPSTRSPEQSGRFPVQSRPDTEHGGDNGHGASTFASGASRRSTCLQHSPADDSSSCIAVSRPQGRVHGCHVGALGPWEGPPVYFIAIQVLQKKISGPQGRVHGRHVGALGPREGPPVCFSAIQNGPLSPAEDCSVTRSQGDSDRSTATGSFMVSGVDGSVPRRSDPAVRRGSNTADSRRLDRRRGDRDSSLPAIKYTRVETLRTIRTAKGHSREAVHMISRSLRDSSLQMYESHWATIVSFCRSKRWQVFKVRSHHFSTYLMQLFRDGLLPVTIISHRTSVASVLHHWVYDPAADTHIKLLIRAFRLECPVQCRIMPKWDLHLVLSSLLRPPFASECDIQRESSDDVIPLQWRTMKTVFLLALASARRHSYLHALSVTPDRCVFARGNTLRQLVVSLLPEPGFLVKNQLPSQDPEWISVLGIPHMNPSEAERVQCPVRQLKLYLRDSESLHRGRQRMFVHWNRYIRDIMRSRISRWIMETVKEVMAHEVRALSASLAYNCQVALPDILSAAFWRSSGGLPEFVSTGHGLYR